MAREIAIPFGVDATGSIRTVSDPVAIARQHLTTFVATSPTERVMRPAFGTPVQEYVFEPITTVTGDMLRTRIASAVQQNVADVVLRGLSISETSEDGTMALGLEFSQALDTDIASTSVEEATLTIIGGTA